MSWNNVKKHVTRKRIFIVTVLLIIFFLSMRIPLDPDLGWHLRSGQYLWENKAVAEGDPFSHTFSEYPWIAHEWLTDLMLYGLNSLGPTAGPIAMTAVFALISTLAFYLAGKSFSARKEYQLLASLLALLVSISIVGVRPQVISMLGLGALFYILYRFRINQSSKLIYIIPIILMVWVNLHGGFSFGLFVLGLFFTVELLRVVAKKLIERIKKKEIHFRILSKISFIKIAIIGLLSGAATLVNPYGIKIYYEIYYTLINTTGSAVIRQNIGEWTPVQFNHEMSRQLIIYLILFAILLLFSLRKIDITHLIITVVFFIIGISSWRHMPLLMLAITPFWVAIAQALTGQTLAKVISKKYIIFLFIIALVIVSRQQITGFLELGIDPVKTATKGRNPYDAVQYLKANPLKGKMYNEYNHGGYLVWNYPEKKVFIDGRMAIWELDGKNVYTDWQIIGRGEDGYLELLDQYDVDWVIVRWQLKLADELRKNDDWEEIYRDDLVSITIRKGSQDED
ncbi:hypothetical protein KKG41_07050 [Patescibacteria group bacterium]|nr:hypothetical protein [Patescibacteria group bacterium]